MASGSTTGQKKELEDPEWLENFVCSWTEKGKLKASGFPEDMYPSLRLYMAAIWPRQWPRALEMIMDQQNHTFIGDASISFSSNEGEEQDVKETMASCTFCTGPFPLATVPMYQFLMTLWKALEQRPEGFLTNEEDKTLLNRFHEHVKNVCSLAASKVPQKDTEGKTEDEPLKDTKGKTEDEPLKGTKRKTEDSKKLLAEPQPTSCLSIDEVTSDSVKVSWQPPEDPTGIIGYRLYYSAGSPTLPWVAKEKSKPLDVWSKEGQKAPYSRVLDTLMPNTKYDITVWSMGGSRDDPVLSSPTSVSVTTEIPTVTGLHVTAYDTTSISISWTAVTAWRAWPIPEIRVYISAPDCPDETTKLPGETSTTRFENLHPATLYTIHVAALGFWGKEGKPTTVTCPTRPRPITSISICEQTTTVIKAKWPAAEDKDVTYMAQITGKDPILVGKDLACCFDELEPGTSYDISITVKRTFEDGREVDSRPRKTKAFTCPSHPESVSVKSYGHSSVTLAWQPPAAGNIDCYRVEIWCTDQTKARSDEHKPEHSRLIGKYSTEYTFDSLSTSPGSLHKVTISSYFQNLSSEIVEIMQRTKLRSPDLKLREKTQTSITVSWEHVMGEKEKYVLSISPNEGEPDVVIPCHENRLQHKFRNLVPGKEYKASAITIYKDAECEPCTVTIVTLREDVESEERVVEEQTIVGQPKNVRVKQAGDGALTLKWEDAEGDKNGYILEIASASEIKSETYRYVSRSQARRYELTNLVPGRLYYITIKTTSHGRHSEPVTLQARTIVARARNFARENVKERSIAVSWTSALGEVDKYILQISSETWAEQVPITHSEGRMSYIFGDLEPGRHYNISIKTDREGDYSDEVPLLRVRTMVSKPVNLKVEDKQTDSLRVVWTSAEGDKDAYHIRIDPQDGDNPSAILKSTDELAYTFKELNPGRLYTVRVVTDSGGDKSLAEVVKRRTLPSPPRAVGASVQGTGILVTWEPAIGDKDKYILKLFYYEKDTGEETDPLWREVEEGKPTQQMFPQLQFGRMYHVHVITRTDDIDSEPVATSRRMTVDRPKNVSVMHKTETTAIIKWDHAQGDKDKYAVEIQPNSQTGYENEVDQEQLTYDFDDLQPGRLHHLSVYTISGDDRSKPERTQFTTLARPPNKIYVNKEDVKEKSLRVFWLEPESDVDHYGISISHLGKEISRHEISASPREYLFGNLTPGRLYTISVWTYVGDLGSTSAPISVQERTLVASAKTIRVEDCTHSSISFSWDKADGDVDYYEYRVMYGEVCVNTNIKTQSSDQRWVQVDDLTGGRLYELVVVAVRSDRRSLPTKRNHRTKVHKPEGLHVADVKMQQVTITWEQAQGDKDKYTAVVFDTTHQDRTPKSKGDVSATASALEHRFSALVPGREYEVVLRTINGGDASDPEKRLVRTKPLPPVNVRTSAVDTGIMVEWSEPSGDKDEYLLEISPKEDLHTPIVISTGDETSYTFPGVTLGKLYDVKIFTRSKDVDSGKVIRQQRMTVGQPNLVHLHPFETSVKVTWDHAEGEKERYHITVWDVGRKTCVWREERNADEDLEVLFDALVSGRLYGVEVTTESGGELSECVPKTVRTKIRPPAQINIADNDVKENSLRITWRKPDCDIDMDCYHVSISPENAIGVVEKGQPLEYTFHNLTSGRKYQLSVTTDSGGDKSGPVTKTKRTTVSRTEQINVRERTETTLTITWLDVKGDKSSYIASIREMTAEISFQRFPDIRIPAYSLNSQRFSNLTAGRMYEVSVVTVSGEMESLARTMLVRTIVSPPRNVMIPQDSVTEHSMDVVWEDARGDYKSYEHLISPKEGTSRYMGEESLDGTQVHRSRFENLFPCKLYTIELWTRQEEADSEVKVQSHRTKVAAVEETSIVFTNISENEVTLGWKEAEGEKDGYTVTIHPFPDDTTAVTPPPAEVKADDDLQHTFRDLTPGQKHAISIVTFKENDKSSEVTKTVHTKPNKPEGFRVETFAESIAVSWYSPKSIQDGYVLKITTVPEDPEYYIQATFDEKTMSSNDEVASVLDECNETRHFTYTFREKGTIKARTKYKISAQTKSGKKQNGGQCSDVIVFEGRTKPHPPRDPRLVKEDIESVTFSWAPPIDVERKRDIHRYIVRYKRPEDENEREHDCQFNTWAKIEHLRDDTNYDFFIISVVETRAEDGTVERVDSERCRFTFKTMSQSTKIARQLSKLRKALPIVICGGAFAIYLFIFLGVFVHNCVRPYGQSEMAATTVIPSGNSSNTPTNNSSVRPTASAQSFNSGLAECFFEKAGEQFWYLVFFTAVPAICLLAIFLWKVIKRIRQNIRRRATPDAEHGLLDDLEVDTEMTEMHPVEDIPKLVYGRNAT
ncbi:PREDICTED: receptor-type tyrosine-protein phosphatase beta-like [Branchiostoma belcheri]|uniref:Receptor-type tyrosine-protein phosphatase beta-like n=1 Tax=Branchiostoma belcheri TaxID=7741 RepID=A0A6P4Y846_BRABE|nr:PREDICTED: receptor-type tyrosine-protein phosphatase beta-like [Branchiostoma belcheri]